MRAAMDTGSSVIAMDPSDAYLLHAVSRDICILESAFPPQYVDS